MRLSVPQSTVVHALLKRLGIQGAQVDSVEAVEEAILALLESEEAATDLDFSVEAGPHSTYVIEVGGAPAEAAGGLQRLSRLLHGSS